MYNKAGDSVNMNLILKDKTVQCRTHGKRLK